jgi:hypothetical protein
MGIASAPILQNPMLAAVLVNLKLQTFHYSQDNFPNIVVSFSIIFLQKYFVQ